MNFSGEEKSRRLLEKKQKRLDPAYRNMEVQWARKWQLKNYEKFLQIKLVAQNRRRLRMFGIGNINDNEWETLKRKYNYMCLCCKKQEPFVRLSIDHIVPISMGGSNTIENIQPLCRSCNSRKNNKIISYIPMKTTASNDVSLLGVRQ